MSKERDRTGEENYNNFGSKMIIIRYRMNRDIDVYFPEYNWTFKNTYYSVFKNGKIRCPYEKRYYGIGYIGEGKYKIHDKNGKLTKCYNTCHDMLKRCYDEKFHKNHPTYINCKVVKKWLNFQNFAEWYYDNYYEIEGQRMCLDKDIINKGNKIYSPENCIFAPEKINTLFVKRNNDRGEYPVGVYYNKRDKKFKTQCNVYDFEENKTKRKNLGLYNSSQQAFESYKEFKENHIKDVADYYKEQIPKKLYDAMYNYEIEIND